ncbi:MAG: glucose-6-phosphate dehydrogenase [Planctomycetes bacterium]|nr:glucose-6-phosphate dehydrogenase [Planctomycetota bacterium]
MDGTRIRVNPNAGPAVVRSRPPDPCVVVIFGVTGDLTHRKLIPALYNLAREGDLPGKFALIGTSTSVTSAAEFRAQLQESVSKFSRSKPLDEEVWKRFAGSIETVVADVNAPDDYAKLRRTIEAVEQKAGLPGNRLYYLAVPPGVFPVILRNLKAAGLLQAAGSPGWSRVVIEKPFGRDLASARELNRTVAEVIDESQIFRSDHYLGKETVQNILVFRFGNSIFEPIWNRKYIDHVQITMAEDLTIERRGKFYDATGVLRDIVQSHLLQVLALCTMEAPATFKADDIRDEKFKLLRSIRPITAGEVGQDVVAAQYRGYRASEGVAKDSRTPTYVALKLAIDNWRWQGVPIYVRAGKGLAARNTEVSIHFQSIPFCLFGTEEVCQRIEPNVLTLRIQPREGIALRFGCKVPGEDLSVGSVTMDFSYADSFNRAPWEAYERLLLDAMRGDHTLFARRDGDEQAWSFVSPILEAWEARREPLPEYDTGSAGPREADDLLRRDGRRWRPLA